MSLTAPYSHSMRIGQGFNSYTQEIRIENAVKIQKNREVKNLEASGSDFSQSSSKSNGDLGIQSLRSSQTGAKRNGGSDESGRAAPFSNSKVIAAADDALFQRNPENVPTVFSLGSNRPHTSSQSVTFSTRAIENVSDIMDALNISIATSIKYGTIHGNASAAFVNENKVLDSQLNYIVSVKVNNETSNEADEMEFLPINGVLPEMFTSVFGDSFISGFLEGGEFNAVISVDVHDKSKLRQVKQAIDVQLAVGPSPVSVGASESVDKQHAELLQDTEITISVNWIGGGEIKKPEVPWTISSIVAVANAFPSMVARCSAKTSAILTRYTSLRSYQAWVFEQMQTNPRWGDKDIILNYAPCAIYTTDLFDALMAYKKLWKRIDLIMQDMTKWKPRKAKDIASKFHYELTLSPEVENGHGLRKIIPPVTRTSTDTSSVINENESPDANKIDFADLSRRNNTFSINDPLVKPSWDLKSTNEDRTPIPLDPIALNEARLLCREAMTLITEEAARLVNHPQLAYAEFDGKTGKTRMKRPNYAYPEVLKDRLPTYISNDASDDSFSRDAAAMMVHTYSRNNDLFSHLVGDFPNPHRKYRAFVSLSLNEDGGDRKELVSLSLHAYHHHSFTPAFGRFSRDSLNAIGAIGFRFAGDSNVKADGCAHWVGKPHLDDASRYQALDLTGGAAAKIQGSGSGARVNVSRIDISYVPGSGRIAGLALFDNFGEAATERLAWKQWGSSGRQPEGLKTITQEPPPDGGHWKFIGFMGDWDEDVWGSVLSRVSGIWRRS